MLGFQELIVVAFGLLLVVLVGVVLARLLSPQGDGEDPAVTLLRERYADGEISDDEYEEKLRQLKHC